MKKILLSIALASVTALCISAAKPQVPDSERVLMTIDNTPVTLGEFEYLYHKNNSQQIEPQTIDQYLDMFINYKLKVAEARAAGIDTTAAFVTELRGYTRDLAKPYLKDTEVEQQLIDKMYDRMQQDVNVSHIMRQLNDGDRQLLDSVRTLILDGKITFEDAAAQYSIDRASSSRGGNMGFIRAGVLPYTFEDKTYETPLGQISEVFDTPFGYHIVKPIEARKARGQVLAQHILKLTQGMTPEQKAAQRHAIDSIHTLLVEGANFDNLASRESQDTGSARQGGRLPWFSTGMMVKPFEDATFALADGEISDIVETDYGFHIIKRLDSKGLGTKDEMTSSILEILAQDERGDLPRKAKLDAYKERYHLTMNRPCLAMVESMIKSAGALDSTVLARLQSMPAPVAMYDNGGKVLLTDAIAGMQPMDGVSPASAYDVVLQRVNALVDRTITDKAIDDLADENPDYRNLLNEYSDGILLFDISDRTVWSRAKEDAAGLDNWFNTHRDRYTWSAPKFKSYIIFATSDSVLNVADKFLADHDIAPKDLAVTLRQLCGRDIRVERVIAAQGDNAIIDYLGFNGEKPAPAGKWIVYEAYKPTIIDAPQEVADERGAITSDYQNYLEEQWIKQLRSNHKVKVDKKVLKLAK